MSSKKKKQQKRSSQQFAINMLNTGNSDKIDSTSKFSSNSNGNAQVPNYWRKPDPVEVAPIPINNKKKSKKQKEEKNEIKDAAAAETRENENFAELMNENVSIQQLSDDQLYRLIRMMSKELEMATLLPEMFEIPPKVVAAEKSRNLPKELQIENFRESKSNYYAAYSTMVYLEETAQKLFIETFNQTNISIFYEGNGNIFYILNDDQMVEVSAAIDECILDTFYLLSPNNESASRICGKIKGKNQERIFIEFEDEHFSMIHKNYLQPHDIFFQLNRIPFQAQHIALYYIKKHNLFNHLIKNPLYDCVEKSDSISWPQFVEIEISDVITSKLNREQKAAVDSIVNTKNYPSPFILFGPPGTGKTRTLVAAIEQIIRSTTEKILVCAQSNAAADEIAIRLTNTLTTNQMFRMYAKSFDERKLNSVIEPYSNWTYSEEKKFIYPSFEFLAEFRVIVCTLSTSCCFARARIPPNHFSYVFIDECASAHETSSLIPIAGVCTTNDKILASIVLAGDPKQLDAVTKSQLAEGMGFKTSFLENLFNQKLYQRDPETGKFNEKYIIQLVRNYRSHPAILKIPNQSFYDGTLLAQASKDVTNWYINSPLLPSKKFPIIFRSVQGYFERSEVNKSLFNQKEVNAVIDCIKKLLSTKYLPNNPLKRLTQNDIGVVTPYKMQRRKIWQACHNLEFDNITVGTAEVFQGQEKPVMIISTVRSGGDRSLTFVNNDRRFNVMITRAKCLLIIVGDADTLKYARNWNRLIEFCEKNNAITKYM